MSTEEPRTESTPQRSESSPQAIAAAKRLGAPMIVRGILGVVFGLVTVFWPRGGTNPAQLSLPTDVVDHLAIGYLILFALVLVFQAARSPLNVRTAVYGQAVIAIPAIVFLFMADQPADLRAALSIWALLHGALEFYSWRQLRAQPMASDFLIASGVHVLLGIILVFGDGMEALSILGFTGAATLIAGVIFIIGGYSRLSKGRQLAKLGALPEQIDTPAEAADPADATARSPAAAPLRPRWRSPRAAPPRLSQRPQLATLGALPEQIDPPAEAAAPADATDRSDAAASGAPGAADADDSEDPDDPDNDTPVKK